MAVYLYLYFYKMYVLFFGGAQKCSYVPKGGPPEKVWEPLPYPNQQPPDPTNDFSSAIQAAIMFPPKHIQQNK